jgi:hypothetical protein
MEKRKMTSSVCARVDVLFVLWFGSEFAPAEGAVSHIQKISVGE